MRNIWRAFQFVLPHRGMLAAYIFTAICLGLCSGAPLVLLKTYLNKLEQKPPTDKLGIYVDDFLLSQFGHSHRYLYGLCAVMLLLWVFKAVFDFLNTYISSWLSQRLRMEAMNRVMGKLLVLDQPFFDKNKSGDL